MDAFYDSEHIQLTQLHENLKPIIWLIEVSGTIKKEETKVFATGFSMRNDGLVMTCAHTIRGMIVREIKARRLNEEKFETAKIKNMWPKWDLALLQVDKVIDCSVGEFVSDGSLWEGQRLLYIGHSRNLVGSYLIGRACFPCIADVIPPKNSETCGEYDPTARKKTPEYRVMGHVWNTEYFTRNRDVSSPFEKSLVPTVPIIQCNGFNTGPGCSGGPIFNMKGKVVGMLIAGLDGYDIAIHVAALKMFFSDATKPSEPEDTSKKQRTC